MKVCINTIKKYEKEWNHLINGGTLLVKCFDVIADIQYKQWMRIDKEYTTFDSDYGEVYIINDEYVEYRKALADGKTIQYYVDSFVGWQDVTSVGDHAMKGIKEYRIKPDTHNVKVTTFRDSGKYYDEFYVEVEAYNAWNAVSEAVRKLKPTYKVQSDLDWLIGMTEDGLHKDVANGVYPMILKS